MVRQEDKAGKGRRRKCYIVQIALTIIVHYTTTERKTDKEDSKLGQKMMTRNDRERSEG
jgi:predicted transcriptional regulator